MGKHDAMELRLSADISPDEYYRARIESLEKANGILEKKVDMQSAYIHNLEGEKLNLEERVRSLESAILRMVVN